MKKVYVVGWQYCYASWIEDAEITGDYEEPKFDIDEADVVLFTGGEDINPAIYGKRAHPSSYWPGDRSPRNEEYVPLKDLLDPTKDLPPYITGRDAREIEAFRNMKPGQVAYGTCRGLAMLPTLNAVNCWKIPQGQSAAKPYSNVWKVQRLGVSP